MATQDQGILSWLQGLAGARGSNPWSAIGTPSVGPRPATGTPWDQIGNVQAPSSSPAGPSFFDRFSVERPPIVDFITGLGGEVPMEDMWRTGLDLAQYTNPFTANPLGLNPLALLSPKVSLGGAPDVSLGPASAEAVGVYDDPGQFVGPLPPEQAAVPSQQDGFMIPANLANMPQPPMYDIEGMPQYDMEALQGAKRDTILSGLAGGAGSVDATEAGSFAKALALAGAGGAAGAAAGTQSMAETEFKNASIKFEAAMENKKARYGHDMALHKATLPQVSATKDSITIQEYDKESDSYKLRVIPTGTALDNASKMADLMKVITGDGPLAETQGTKLIVDTYGNDPVALEMNLRLHAIQRTLNNGGGRAVFGELYDTALEEVEGRVPFGVMQDAEEYQRVVQKEMTTMLFQWLQENQDDGWLKGAEETGSYSARLLRHGQ